MKKWEKNRNSGQNSRGGTGTEQSGTGTVGACFSVLTSVRILAITCSFLIQFE